MRGLGTPAARSSGSCLGPLFFLLFPFPPVSFCSPVCPPSPAPAAEDREGLGLQAPSRRRGPASMGGKQSTAACSRGPFPGVSTDDAVPPPGGAPHFSGTTGGRRGHGARAAARSAPWRGKGMDPSTASGVPLASTPRLEGPARPRGRPGSGGSTSDSTYAHGNGYQETGGVTAIETGCCTWAPRASLADALPLHIAPRWFSFPHSGESAAPEASEGGVPGRARRGAPHLARVHAKGLR